MPYICDLMPYVYVSNFLNSQTLARANADIDYLFLLFVEISSIFLHSIPSLVQMETRVSQDNQDL